MIKSVMLIDDDLDEHELFIGQLAEYNKSMNVISAYDGPQAFDMLYKILPDCIFLDINMPKMNGLQVLKQLKHDARLQQIPVFIYSTSDGYRSKKPALELGAALYLKKPANPEDLLKIFGSVFGK